MARSVYVITDLDGGDSRTFEDPEAAFSFWDQVVGLDRSHNLSFIQVDIGRKPRVWTLGLKIEGYLVSSGMATKKQPGGACQMPRQLRR